MQEASSLQVLMESAVQSSVPSGWNRNETDYF